MGVLPSYFEQLNQSGENTGLIPITYSSAAVTFFVAEARVPLREFDPFDFDSEKYGVSDDGIDAADLESQPLYLMPLTDRLLATAAFHRWILRHPKAVGPTRRVVKSVYESIVGEHLGLVGEPDTHFDFAARLKSHGAVEIQTLGNCACLGVSADGRFIRGKIEHGFGEYELHNAGKTAQRVSLFAGLGHLAFLAAQDRISR